MIVDEIENETVDMSSFECLNLDENEAKKFKYLVQETAHHQRLYPEFNVERQLRFLTDKIRHNKDWIDFSIKMGPEYINKLRRAKIIETKIRTVEDDIHICKQYAKAIKNNTFHACILCYKSFRDSFDKKAEERMKKLWIKLGIKNEKY